MHDSSLHVGSQPCIRLHLTLWKMFTLRVNGFPSHFSKREVQNPPSVGQGSWPRIFMGPPPSVCSHSHQCHCLPCWWRTGGIGVSRRRPRPATRPLDGLPLPTPLQNRQVDQQWVEKWFVHAQQAKPPPRQNPTDRVKHPCPVCTPEAPFGLEKSRGE